MYPCMHACDYISASHAVVHSYIHMHLYMFLSRMIHTYIYTRIYICMHVYCAVLHDRYESLIDLIMGEPGLDLRAKQSILAHHSTPQSRIELQKQQKARETRMREREKEERERERERERVRQEREGFFPIAMGMGYHRDGERKEGGGRSFGEAAIEVDTDENEAPKIDQRRLSLLIGSV